MRRPELIVGWREWLHLPDLGVRWIKAKIDTGARTSALHADAVEYFRRRGESWVRFLVHPRQRSQAVEIQAESRVMDEREVRSSNGALETRPVILTTIDVGGVPLEIEMSLTRRDVMGFRLLVGRQALRGHAWVDPGRSYLTRKQKKKKATRRARPG